MTAAGVVEKRPRPAEVFEPVTVKARELRRALADVRMAIPARATLPVLGYARIEAHGTALTLTGSDLSTAIHRTIDADGTGRWSALAAPRLLAGFLQSFGPGEDVRLSVIEGKRRSLRLQAENVSAVTGPDELAEVDNYPAAALYPAKPSLLGEFDSGELLRALDTVLPACARDDSRPVLTTVQAKPLGLAILGAEKRDLQLTTADGFRLHRARVSFRPGEAAFDPWPAVPYDAWRALAQVLRRQPPQNVLVSVCTVATDTENVLFTTGVGSTSILACPVRGASYPDYDAILPGKWTCRLTLPSAGLERAVRAAVPFAAEGSGIIRLTPSAGGVLQVYLWRAKGGKRNGRDMFAGEDYLPAEAVEARAQLRGDQTSVDARLMSLTEGEPHSIAFNYVYLLDTLKALNASDITIETTSPSSPGLFRPAGVDDGPLAVVMPMYVQW